MAKNVDGPPTLAKPKGPAAKKADNKAKFAEMKAKAKANRPAAKLTLGVVVDGKFAFTKQEFSNPLDAVNQAVKSFNKQGGKGLREIILSFHK